MGKDRNATIYLINSPHMNDFSLENLKKIKYLVSHVLENHENTRNSDKLLAMHVWKITS